MTFFEESVFFGVSVSLVSYGLGAALQKKSKSALCNPLLISVAVTIAVLVTAEDQIDGVGLGDQPADEIGLGVGINAGVAGQDDEVGLLYE